MKFSNILLVLDPGPGYEPALRRAMTLAESEHAALTICSVVDSIPASYQRSIVAVTPRELTDLLVTRRMEQLEESIRSIDASSLLTGVKVLVGESHLEVTREVRKNCHDLVIKSVTGYRTLRGPSIGRDDKELLRICPCPVWFVNAGDDADDSCIIAALDLRSARTADIRLNERILRVSTSIALAEFRELHIVHAWQLTGEDRLRSRGTVASILELDRMIAREAAQRMIWLQGAVNSSTTVSDRIAIDYLAPELHVVKGTPRNVVPDLVNKLGAGLVVMGTAARTGLSGLWPGNTSEKIVARADCSFLIVKHQDFAEAPKGPPFGQIETSARTGATITTNQNNCNGSHDARATG